ncbi:MAG: serine/threonine-protein kinase, partial [Solirubrobacteraceae bacterium]
MGDRSPAGVGVRPDLGLPERYEPLRHIATGGMASVWCARDRALGRNVAIKLLAERFAYDDGAMERFMREARAAARLSGHPNVVMIYDVGETGTVDENPSSAFIVMEYLAGGTVADALRVDSVRRVHAAKWVHEAASAVDYAHSRGVLHRDIKPANLLLDRARVLHVADFGIARLGTEDTITASGQVLCTASYLAPERALGRPATDASDRYSLAVAAYELLVGERPFTATNFAVQARQHVEDEPPAASERNRALPPAVDAVLARGMAKRPEQR